MEACSSNNKEIRNSDHDKALLRRRDLEIESLQEQIRDLHYEKFINSSNRSSKNNERESNDHKYKMKLDKFKGKDDEDFDLWWEDLRAFFALYKFNEEDKLRLINAHLGGAERRVVQNEDMESISTVEKLHELLRGTFSDKHDWQNILLNTKQYPEEKIKAFADRLRVAALKCGFKGKILDNMCFNYLRKCTLPHISALLDNCLPGTSFDIALEHAIQFERKKEVEGEKKNSKRKA